MQDVLAKLKEIQENYDNEDIQRAITAAEKTAVAEEEVSEEAEETVEEAIEDGKTYAWINVETGDHGYGTKEESSNWTHYIPMSDFSYFSGDDDYKNYPEEVAKQEGWIAVEESVEEDSVNEVHEEEAVEETVEVPVSALQELMKLAGYEEYKIDEYANEPEEEYSSAEDQMDLGGGLNGPKKAYAAAAGADNPMDQEPTEIEEDDKLTFEGMYKRYMGQVVEETLKEHGQDNTFDESSCVREMKKLYAQKCPKMEMARKLKEKYGCDKKKFEELYASNCG